MATARRLKDLPFSELYLGHPSLGNRYSEVQGAALVPVPEQPALHGDLASLLAVCRRAFDEAASPFALRIHHDGEYYRAGMLRSMEGPVFILSRIALDILPLRELGIPQAYLPLLLRHDLSGLLLVTGAPKSGKTMTACALVRERLLQHGGVAITGESPVELPLEGNHGTGVCFQTTMLGRHLSFGDGFQELLRIGTRTVFVDEVRDEHAAAQLLQESCNGNLIITTMAAESMAHAITKLETLSQRVLGLSSARAMLAEGLSIVLHQRLTPGPKIRLEAELLNVRGSMLIRSTLRSGKHEMLVADVRKQSNTMIAESAFTSRLATA